MTDEEIKETCQFMAEKIKNRLTYGTIHNLKNTPSFGMSGGEHETVWPEMINKYQTDGSIAQK
jgi:hypothetical protein